MRNKCSVRFGNRALDLGSRSLNARHCSGTLPLSQSGIAIAAQDSSVAALSTSGA